MKAIDSRASGTRAATLAATLFLVAMGAPLLAQEAPPLGRYHFTLNYSSMMMQHVTFETDDVGLHVGLDAYRHVGRGWYIGAEIGAGGSLVFFGDDSDISTYEANAKRIFALGRALRLDLGGGLSYNHVSYRDTNWFGSQDDVEIDDWVPGIQALANLQLKLGAFIAGAHLKYMLTGDVEGVQEVEELEQGWDYSSLMAGIHFGFLIR